MQEGHQELYDCIRELDKRVRTLERHDQEQGGAIAALERRLAAIEQEHASKIEVYNPATHELLGVLGGVHIEAAQDGIYRTPQNVLDLITANPAWGTSSWLSSASASVESGSTEITED